MTSLEAELASLLGPEALHTGDATLPYLHDSTELQGLKGRADAVVAPADAEGICRLVEWCYAHGAPIVPRGGGTGFAGGSVPVEGGVVCSLERLDRVRSLDPELWRMEVEAGVTTARVHKLARENGLMFPPDPGASEQSQIGGNVACNAGGPHSFKYGVTGAWVTGLEAVIGGGRLLQAGGPLRKDVAGLDLKSLLIGSEGTLGIVTRAWLRLAPAPELTVPIVAAYSSTDQGVRALGRVYASGVVPAALEFFDSGSVAAARAAFPGDLVADARFLVLAEADGSRASAQEVLGELEEALAEGALDMRRFSSPGELRSLWRWRNGISYAVSARRGGKMSEDIAVPFESLGAAVEMTRELGARHGLEACSWGHAGDGNVHATFMLDARSEAEVACAHRAAEELFEWVLGVSGTVSGEHGLGWVKRAQFRRQFRAPSSDLQLGIKALFDPKGLFNPGKKLPFPEG